MRRETGRPPMGGFVSNAFSRGAGLRAALLAGASAIALVTLGQPAAWAGCSGALETISVPNFPGPVAGDSAGVTINPGASVLGGPTGVAAMNCGINALSNSGRISGANATIGAAGGGVDAAWSAHSSTRA
ncbi:MAG TPA: hypothetical protein VEH77_17250 [Roseiarcus sp.]|nr:hypothetical protein [Roseiarcus sp.]